MNSQDDKKKFVKLECKTWTRDSYGLFDYETSDCKNSFAYIAENRILIRDKNEVKVSPYDNFIPLDENVPELGRIIFDDNDNKIYISSEVGCNLKVNNKTMQDLQDKIWHVIKASNLNSNGGNNVSDKNNLFVSNYQYTLKKNDIIKLGRIKYLVKDLNIVNQSIESSRETFDPHYELDKIEPKNGEFCRICHSSTPSDDNPILSLCKCKGSVDLIHFLCLKKWCELKLSTRETINKPGVTHVIKSFNCELCKEPYQTTISYNGNYYNLIYSTPENQNYIILESLNSIKENAYPLSVHILMFLDDIDYNSYVLGRGHEADLRISDISVSRLHAKIFMKDNKYIIEDLSSKFGTLVLATDPIEITEENKVIQIGRTLVSISKTDEDLSHESPEKKALDLMNKNSGNVKRNSNQKDVLKNLEFDNYDINVDDIKNELYYNKMDKY